MLKAVPGEVRDSARFGNDGLRVLASSLRESDGLRMLFVIPG